MAGHRHTEPSGSAPIARLLGQGEDWRVSEYICTAGPADRPFEERHETFSVSAVIEGTFHYRSSTGNALLHPGSFLLGNLGTCFECGHEHGSGDRCVALHLEPEFFREVAAGVTGSARFEFPVAMLPAIPIALPLVAALEARAAHRERIERDEAVTRLLEATIATLCANPSIAVHVAARDVRRINDVLRHIEERLEDPVDLMSLAALARMSKYHFLRTFRRSVGLTPYQYLLGARLRRAAVRLATTREPVSAIAFATGFGDLSTFNARFRTTFGKSPTVYRRDEGGLPAARGWPGRIDHPRDAH